MLKPSVFKLIAAFIYDLFPIVGIFLLTSLMVALVRNGNIVKPHTLWFDLLLLAELAFYYIYSWKVGGQTLGMRAWKLKIKPNNLTQRTLSWNQASIRLVVGVISTALLGLGIYWKFFNKDKKSWMDMVSQSRVEFC